MSGTEFYHRFSIAGVAMTRRKLNNSGFTAMMLHSISMRNWVRWVWVGVGTVI